MGTNQDNITVIIREEKIRSKKRLKNLLKVSSCKISLKETTGI